MCQPIYLFIFTKNDFLIKKKSMNMYNIYLQCSLLIIGGESVSGGGREQRPRFGETGEIPEIWMKTPFSNDSYLCLE